MGGPTRLAGRYEYLRELGGGGGGRVILAKDAQTDELRALKTVEPVAFSQLLGEWSLLTSIEHPRLTRVFELLRLDAPLEPPFGLARGASVLVESFVEGNDADAHVEGMGAARRAKESASIIYQVGRALLALHGVGILHGDIKPANIVVGARGATLVDMGLAGPPRSSDGRLRGTPGYLAPEAWLGERSVGTEVFALGATLHRLLAGGASEWGSYDTQDTSARPFEVPNTDDLSAMSYPTPLVELVRSMVAHDVAERPSSIRDVLVRLSSMGLALGESEDRHASQEPSLEELALRSRSVAWVGDERLRERLVEGISAGGLVWVQGPSGSGRSRLIRDAVAIVQRRRAEAMLPVPTYLRLREGSRDSAPPRHLTVRHIEGVGSSAELLHDARAARLGNHTLIVETDQAPPRAFLDSAHVQTCALDAPQLETLVGSLLGSSSPSLVAAARSSSGGLAGRLCRTVADAFAQGLDARRAETLAKLPLEGANAAVPEAGRDLSERLAVAGGSLDAQTVAEAARPMRVLLADGLASISTEGRLVLRRDVMIQILSEIPTNRRAALAKSLRADDAVSRAHLAASALEPDAAALFAQAAQDAADEGRLAEAQLIASDGLGLVPESERGPLADLVARVRLWAGRYAHAAEVAQDPALLAEIARRAGRSAEAENALTSAQPSAEVETTRAWLAYSQGDLDAAIAHAPGDESGQEVLGWVALSRGDVAKAEEHVRHALATVSDSRLKARLMSSLGVFLKARGDLESAATVQRNAADLAGSLGLEHLAASAGANLGAVLFELGHLGRAITVLGETAYRQLRLGRDRDVARSLFNLALAERAVGQVELAMVHADYAREAADRCQDTLAQDAVNALDALFELATGRVDDAVSRASALSNPAMRALLALELARPAPVRARELLPAADDYDSAACLARAAVEFSLGERAEAARWLSRVEAESMPWFESLNASLLRARLTDRPSERRLALTRARSLLDRAGADLPLAERARLRRLPQYAPALEAERDVRLPQASGRWRRLGALTKRFASERRPNRLRDELSRAALDLVDAERACLVERSLHGELRVLARVGPGDESVSRSIVGRALDSGDTVVTVDASRDDGFGSASAHAMALRSVVCVPLPRRSEVLYLDDRARPAAFDENDLALLADLADLASITLANAEYLRAGRREARRLLERERELEAELAGKRAELDALRGRESGGLVFVSDVMERAITLAAKVARSNLPVLIRGESGTGKELIARLIRDRSARESGPYIRENCGAIPDSLLESALFGHERGAFTGATQTRIGLFEAAHGGTLFLDEVGEMSASMQAKLLRVVQDGEVRRLGGEQMRRVDVRLITATHRDLMRRVDEGSFREDLYYRLAVARIELPPLRDRIEDIVPLVRTLLDRHHDNPPKVSVKAMSALQAFGWPGNVRQLENELRRALVVCDGRLEVEHLSPEVLVGEHGVAAQSGALGADLKARVAGLETQLIREALQVTGGNITQAAKRLGVSRYGLQKMMKRLEIQT